MKRDWLIVGSIRPPLMKDGARVAGGVARAAKLSPERRSEIAREAAQTRWAKKKADTLSSAGP